MKDMNDAFGNLTLPIAVNVQQMIDVGGADSEEWKMQSEPQNGPTDHERRTIRFLGAPLILLPADEATDTGNQSNQTDTDPEQRVCSDAIRS
jgi:hypothetical protein